MRLLHSMGLLEIVDLSMDCLDGINYAKTL
jgi:hypothetical protein